MNQNFSNAPSSIFTDINYLHYVVEYQGNLIEESKNSTTYYVTIINTKYAIISIPFTNALQDRFTYKNNPFPSVIYIPRYSVYTLQESESLNPILASNINLTQITPPFYLTGKSVVIGMLDTGIDYLNKELMDIYGNTRILKIWDQTINSPIPTTEVPFGSIYSNKDINSAIAAYNTGNNPYDIVPSQDTIGHGTSMAGIIGATGITPELRGAAPNCEFIMIKLAEASAIKPALTPTVPVYDRSSIFLGLNYLYNYAISNNKPLVIYLPIGTTSGNHKGSGLLQDFINEISNNKGIAVVCGAGNEGNTEGHTSGSIIKKGDFQDIPLYISPEQKFLRIEIWIDKPNIMSVDIISASGENSGIIPAFLSQKQGSTYIFEDTTVTVSYFLPEELSGDELIVIEMSSIKSGTWKFRLVADYVLDGTYNAWLLPRGLTKDDTRFISPDPYGTVTNPASSEFVITAANYNQNNHNIVNSSGMAFLNDVNDRIDIACGGIDVQTIGPNNKLRVVSGTSVSAAVAAGASAIMFQWGIVDGNDPNIYSQKLKTYLTRGTSKRINDIYPNAEWGYGILNMLGVFKYLE